MAGNGLFHKLILRWFLLRQQGLTLSTAELCRDCPEHQEEVERSLQGILAPDGRAAGETGPDQNAAPGPLSTAAETAAYTPATGPSPVSGLLLRWQEQREQGTDLSADELCQDCPEHREEVTGRLRVLRDFTRCSARSICLAHRRRLQRSRWCRATRSWSRSARAAWASFTRPGRSGSTALWR